MAVKVVLSNSTRVTSATPDLAGEKLNIPRIVYQKLGSLVANGTLLVDFTAGKLPPEYNRILEELNLLHSEKYYATTNSIPDGIRELDKYLGDLGITEEYPYSKDANNIGAWLAPGTQSEYRVLCEDVDAPQIVLMDGDEILVAYT